MKALKLSVALGLLFVSSLALATPPKGTLQLNELSLSIMDHQTEIYYIACVF